MMLNINKVVLHRIENMAGIIGKATVFFDEFLIDDFMLIYDTSSKKIKIITPMQFKAKDNNFIDEIFKQIKLKMTELEQCGRGWW